MPSSLKTGKNVGWNLKRDRGKVISPTEYTMKLHLVNLSTHTISLMMEVSVIRSLGLHNSIVKTTLSTLIKANKASIKGTQICLPATPNKDKLVRI